MNNRDQLLQNLRDAKFTTKHLLAIFIIQEPAQTLELLEVLLDNISDQEKMEIYNDIKQHLISKNNSIKEENQIRINKADEEIRKIERV